MHKSHEEDPAVLLVFMQQLGGACMRYKQHLLDATVSRRSKQPQQLPSTRNKFAFPRHRSICHLPSTSHVTFCLPHDMRRTVHVFHHYLHFPRRH